MIQIVIALAIAAVAGGAGFFAGVRVQTAETQGWIEQAAALESSLHDAQAKLATQSAAVKALRAQGEKRAAEAAEARKQAEARVATLAAKVQSLLAEKPAFPEDSCASACRLLQQPL